MSISCFRPTLLATRIRCVPSSSSAGFGQTRAINFGAFGKIFKDLRKPKVERTEDTPAVGDSLYDVAAQEELSPVVRREVKLATWHKSSTANFKTSRRKLNDLSRLIAGRGVDEGVLQLSVSQKGQSERMLSMLALARDHAIAKGLNRDKLVIAQSWVTPGPSLKRIDIKGRGRRGIKHHPSSAVHVLLAEGVTDEEKRRLKKREKARLMFKDWGNVSVPIRNPKPYWTM